MRFLRGTVLAALLAWGFFPELARYAAERRLRAATGALRFLVSRPAEVADVPGALDRIASVAAGAAEQLPADPRPAILEGSVRLVAGQPDRAVEFYKEALALGERAETDLNLGRAYESLGDREKATAAYVRAVWVSPALLTVMLPDVAQTTQARVQALEAALAAGRLKIPPPLPE